MRKKRATEARVSGESAKRRLARVRCEAGQGTVEYVGLILLIGAIVTAVLGAGVKDDGKIQKSVTQKLDQAVQDVNKPGKRK